MVDVQLMHMENEVAWPPHEASVPVCSLTQADSSRLRDWYATWDAYVKERADGCNEAAKKIESLLQAGAGNGSAKEVVRELTEAYTKLEERNRELIELDDSGLDAERLEKLQKGIQRFATLTRFG